MKNGTFTEEDRMKIRELLLSKGLPTFMADGVYSNLRHWINYTREKTLVEGIDIDGNMKTTVSGYKERDVTYITEIKREIVEEKKTLSDKIFDFKHCRNCDCRFDEKDYMKLKDVKESFKLLISKIREAQNRCRAHESVCYESIAKKTLGDRLI